MANTYFEAKKADIDLHDTHQCLRSVYILHNGADPSCRFCNTSTETIDHLISGSTILALNKYTNRHNRVGQHIHWKK